MAERVNRRMIVPGIFEEIPEERCAHCGRRGRWRWCQLEEGSLHMLAARLAERRGGDPMKSDYRDACLVLVGFVVAPRK